MAWQARRPEYEYRGGFGIKRSNDDFCRHLHWRNLHGWWFPRRASRGLIFRRRRRTMEPYRSQCWFILFASTLFVWFSLRRYGHAKYAYDGSLYVADASALALWQVLAISGAGASAAPGNPFRQAGGMICVLSVQILSSDSD